ncbi:type VI secretion system Vgr family protein [Burkholderia semiarida]|uniref:type VI secretion system Vgr family protein n=1 Tax=Burkholderia TaxID=32008 RepID=UPI00265FEBFC|nr:type VI secretion system Vgr family protein [Burkholderia sp. AU44665]MDN7701566.1 type VI secretion system Vgr family protein [Burkholderia sp. AU44665]
MDAQDIVRAMQGGLLQQDRLLKLDTPFGENVLLPQRTVGWSRIGRHFDFAVDVLSTRSDLKLKDLIGQSVTLWIQQTDRSYQPRNGYVYAARRLGSEGGLTGYQISFASWMHFLKFRRDQRIWQDKPVDEILRDVFNAHPQAKGRFEFALSRPLPSRSYCTQYEDDWNFVHRLMEEEGLFSIWKQADDGNSHTLTITDHLDTCEPLAARSVQFSRYGSNSEVDALVHWSCLRSLHSAALTTRTFDYKYPSPLANPKGTNIPTVSHQLPEQLEVYEYTGPYTYLDQERGDHLTKVRMEEWESREKRFYGTGALRGIDAGRWFELVGHPEHDRESSERSQFAVVEVIWLIENNLPGSNHHGALPHSLNGRLAKAKATFDGQPTSGVTHFDGSEGFFLVEIEAQRKSVPFRSPYEHHKPVMQMQTATVVGPQGRRIYTDELGRVKVQFHWDRIGRRDERSSCWVRVSHPWAGEGFGMIHVPRIGDEVVVSFLDGAPDRPLITGRVSNGNNFVQWKLPDNQALSGLRSRDLEGTQANQVVADDTPGKLQVQVSSDYEQSRLVVGYNTRIDGNAGRNGARGTGWELATDSWGVLRANRGMLVTTETRAGATAAAKDMSETVDRLGKAQQLHDALTKIAQQSEAQDADGHQADIVNTIAAQNEQIRGTGAGSNNEFPELSEPHLVIDGKAGIEITTPATVHVASQQAAITTEGHIGIASGRSLFATVRDTLRLFAQTGPMHLVSAAGDIVLNALTKSIVARAQKQILLESEEILLRAHKFRVEVNGSFLNMDASGVVSGTTGKFTAYAASHDLPGPKDQMVDLSPKKICVECMLKAARGGAALVPR